MANVEHKPLLPRNKIVQQFSSNWDAFPNVSQYGSYDFFSQTIRLNALEIRNIKEAKANPSDYEIQKKLFH